MAKIKLTKGELKRQRDALRRYERYLPTLQLKKQQLQLEIQHQNSLLEAKRREIQNKKESALAWAGLLTDPGVDLKVFLKPSAVVAQEKNIAGVGIPVYERTEFAEAEYDFFLAPLWVDAAIEKLRALVGLQEEMRVIQRGVAILRQELRVATQRVNLFEKVKIPEAEEAIRLIKIYIGDQMTNAVGRSKIAKHKIEQLFVLQGAAA